MHSKDFKLGSESPQQNTQKFAPLAGYLRELAWQNLHSPFSASPSPGNPPSTVSASIRATHTPVSLPIDRDGRAGQAVFT
jgi:hypothetical protein